MTGVGPDAVHPGGSTGMGVYVYVYVYVCECVHVYITSIYTWTHMNICAPTHVITVSRMSIRVF